MNSVEMERNRACRKSTDLITIRCMYVYFQKLKYNDQINRAMYQALQSIQKQIQQRLKVNIHYGFKKSKCTR